jgi:RimJ/RimL family protein N-acetyltransferase
MTSSLIPTLETARLRLRAWQPADLEPYVAMRADPEVSRYHGDGRPQSASKAETGLEWARLGLGRWAVEKRATGSLIGCCGLVLWREGTPEEAGKLGYGFARDAWGKGYGTEAGAAAMHWAFDERGFSELVALTWPENAGSQHVLAKLGFEQDGEADGQYLSMSFFRVRRAAFAASKTLRGARAASD